MRKYSIKNKGIFLDKDGVTVLEFALVAPMLFLILMGILEISMIMFANSILEGATSVAARIGETGYTAGNLTPQQYITQRVYQMSGGLLNTNQLSITIRAYSNFTNVGSGSDCTQAQITAGSCAYTSGTGLGNQVVLYRVTYPWKVFTPLMASLIGDQNGNVNLTAVATVKNENFP